MKLFTLATFTLATSTIVLAFAICNASVSDCAAQEPTADFFVSTDGSDAWSGTLPEPNGKATDGPFASIERAKDAVRELGANREKNVTVLIRGGTYRLKKTVVFGLENSGQGKSMVTYAAYPNETPVFSAGHPIKNWKPVTTALPGLPADAIGKVCVANVSETFHALFDSNGLLPRARSSGFIPLEGSSRNKLHFPTGRLTNCENITDIEVVVRPHHAWIVNILPLKSVDEQKQIALTSVEATYAMNPLHFLKTTKSCWIENAINELDEPGEWVLNTKQRKLYLWPRNDSPVLAPQLTELFRIEGKIDKQGVTDVPVRNLRFRGLTFMHGERYSVDSDDAGLQHDWDMHDKANSLVRLRGTENCIIEECRFAHSGSGAIRVDLYGQKNRISGNHIEHIGGAGILLCGYGPGTKDVNQKNLVHNNHIHHVGEIYSHSPGIMIWQSGENRISNNLVHHTPYTGIIVSGCMTHFFAKHGRELGRTIRRHEIAKLPKDPQLDDVRPYLHTHDNLIEQNEIHHAMEMLGDGNAIYIRGAGAGNVIRRNYIHHLVAPMKMQAAIRTDGGQRDTLIAENLIYKCNAQGIILKLNNRCENNIVADVIAPPRGYYLAVREGPMNDATIGQNVFYSSTNVCTLIDELPAGKVRTTEDRRGRTLARSADANTDRNIYFCAADTNLGETFLAHQQSNGVDSNSRAVDPLFVDPENGDFRFRPESPALEMGIVPFDRSKVGLVKKPTTVDSTIEHQETDQETDRESLVRAKRIMQKVDKDGNGTFEKSENAGAWKRYRKLDTNNDASLTVEELSKQQTPRLEHGGEQKLNVVYKQIAKRSLLLDLYYPAANKNNQTPKTDSSYPLIVYTHGGGWAAGSKQGIANGSFKSVFEKLLGHGFAVASVNYRLCKKNSGVTMRDCVIDSMDAVRYLSKNSETLKLNPKRFYVMGDSAGGQIAQMLALVPSNKLPGDKLLAAVPYKIVAGVSWYGPCDFENTDLFNHDDRKDFRDRFGPRILGSDLDPKTKLERYREMSPANYLSANSPPLLMIQGDKDTTIPVKHAYFMKEKAEAEKAPVEIMIIKNAGHNWRKVDADIDPTREAIIERTVKFFVDHHKK